MNFGPPNFTQIKVIRGPFSNLTHLQIYWAPLDLISAGYDKIISYEIYARSNSSIGPLLFVKNETNNQSASKYEFTL